MDTCGDCLYLDIKDKKYDKYYCPKHRCRKNLMDRACSSIVKRKSSSDGYKPSGCYITTIICDILGFGDDCSILNNLRFFRDTYLKESSEYTELLVEYDQIGPKISEMLIKEENPGEYATQLLHSFIVPCIIAICNNSYKEAVDIYINMVNTLKERYNLNDKIDMSLQNPKEILGKGRLLARTKKVD